MRTKPDNFLEILQPNLVQHFGSLHCPRSLPPYTTGFVGINYWALPGAPIEAFKIIFWSCSHNHGSLAHADDCARKHLKKVNRLYRAFLARSSVQK